MCPISSTIKNCLSLASNVSNYHALTWCPRRGPAFKPSCCKSLKLWLSLTLFRFLSMCMTNNCFLASSRSSLKLWVLVCLEQFLRIFVSKEFSPNVEHLASHFNTMESYTASAVWSKIALMCNRDMPTQHVILLHHCRSCYNVMSIVTFFCSSSKDVHYKNSKNTSSFTFPSIFLLFPTRERCKEGTPAVLWDPTSEGISKGKATKGYHGRFAPHKSSSYCRYFWECCLITFFEGGTTLQY